MGILFPDFKELFKILLPLRIIFDKNVLWILYIRLKKFFSSLNLHYLYFMNVLNFIKSNLLNQFHNFSPLIWVMKF